MKYVFIALFILLSLLRNMASDGGVQARSEDYATHIAIEEHIKQGNLFPEFHKEVKGINSVHQFLPVYHGLVGFHLSAWFLESLGLLLPGAYGFLMDLSLLLLFVGFLFVLQQIDYRERWLEVLVGFLLFLSMVPYQFSRGVEDAFFSQLYSYSFFILALYFYLKQHLKLAIGLLLVAAITYPDVLLWLLPAFILTKGRLVFKIGAFFIWCGLMWALIGRINATGFVNYSLYPFVFLVFAFLLFAKDIFKKDHNIFLLLTSFIIICLFYLVLGMKNFNFSYYSVKLTYPAIFWLVFIVLRYIQFRSAKGLLFMALLLIYFPSKSEFSFSPIVKYFSKTENISNLNYQSMINVKNTIAQLEKQKVCEASKSLVLHYADDKAAQNPNLLFWARNAVLANYDLYDYAFINLDFNQIGSNFFVLTSMPIKEVKEILSKMSISNAACLVVDHQNADLFKNFNLIKEDNGVSYFLLRPSS